MLRLLLIWLIAIGAAAVPATRLNSLESEIAELQGLLRRKEREAAALRFANISASGDLRAASNASASGGLRAASNDSASGGRRELQPFNPPEEQTTLSYSAEVIPTGGADDDLVEMCALHNLAYCFGNDFYLARGKVAWTPAAPLHKYSHVVDDDEWTDCVYGGTGDDSCTLPTSSRALRVNAVDVNRDGQLDLVIGTQYFLGLSANNGI